eukprot:TRINITY_DN31756_c0_g1_i1.p1 TRINITY_DN31756_c0_g1~~TRINITY_DN31756_c0_g1_i1.p1  ORF type:complete len:180 (-),score=27.47 TRINITY_DN31756_c0_g1_i1:18-557(-)
MKEALVSTKAPRPDTEAMSVGLVTKMSGTAEIEISLPTQFEAVLDLVGEDDPALLICWDTPNLVAAVAAMNGGALLPPPWLAGALPISTTQLQVAICAKVNGDAGGGGVICNALIAPNNASQYANLKTSLGYLGFDAFLQQSPALPLGRIFVLNDGGRRTTGVADPVLAPPAPGVPVFQ